MNKLDIPPNLPPRTLPAPVQQPPASNRHIGPVTIICVLRHMRNKYEIGDVTRLYSMIATNVTRPFNFVCLTDAFEHLHNGKFKSWESRICFRSLRHPEWITKQSKMEMFRADLNFRRVLYIDLDTLVIDNIEPLLCYDGSFMCLHDGKGNDYLASGILAFDAKQHTYLYDEFEALSEEERQSTYRVGGGRSDQLFLAHHIRVIPHNTREYWPDMVTSYNYTCVGGMERPKGPSVIVFHGKHKPRLAKESWIKEILFL